MSFRSIVFFLCLYIPMLTWVFWNYYMFFRVVEFSLIVFVLFMFLCIMFFVGVGDENKTDKTKRLVL